MQIVIEMSEETYRTIRDDNYTNVENYCGMLAIRNGTPLPKNHGRLIDADAFIAMMKDATERQRYKESLIDDCLTVDDVIEAIIESLQNEGLAEGDAPTIIEAESEE